MLLRMHGEDDEIEISLFEDEKGMERRRLKYFRGRGGSWIDTCHLDTNVIVRSLKSARWPPRLKCLPSLVIRCQRGVTYPLQIPPTSNPATIF